MSGYITKFLTGTLFKAGKSVAQEFVSHIFVAEGRVAASEVSKNALKKQATRQAIAYGDDVVLRLSGLTGVTEKGVEKIVRRTANVKKTLGENFGIRGAVTELELAKGQAAHELLGTSAQGAFATSKQAKHAIETRAEQLIENGDVVAPQGWTRIVRGSADKVHYVREATEYSFFKFLKNKGIMSSDNALYYSARTRGFVNTVANSNSYVYSLYHNALFKPLRAITAAGDESLLGRLDNSLYRTLVHNDPIARKQAGSFISKQIILSAAAIPATVALVLKVGDWLGLTDNYYDAYKPIVEKNKAKNITKEYLKPMNEAVEKEARALLAAELKVDVATLLDENGKLKPEHQNNPIYMVAVSSGKELLKNTLKPMLADAKNQDDPMYKMFSTMSKYIDDPSSFEFDLSGQDVLFDTEDDLKTFNLAQEDLTAFMGASVGYYKQVAGASSGGALAGKNVYARDLSNYVTQNMSMEVDKEGRLKPKKAEEKAPQTYMGMAWNTLKEFSGANLFKDSSGPVQFLKSAGVFLGDFYTGGAIREGILDVKEGRRGALPDGVAVPENELNSTTDQYRVDLVSEYKKLTVAEDQLSQLRSGQKVKKSEADLLKDIEAARKVIREKSSQVTSSIVGDFKYEDPATRGLDIANMNQVLATTAAVAPRLNMTDGEAFNIMASITQQVDAQKTYETMLQWAVDKSDFSTEDPGFATPVSLVYNSTDAFINNADKRLEITREAYGKQFTKVFTSKYLTSLDSNGRLVVEPDYRVAPSLVQEKLEKSAQQLQQYYSTQQITEEQYNQQIQMLQIQAEQFKLEYGIMEKAQSLKGTFFK